MARRCRKNRVSTIDVWLRSLTVNSRSTLPGGGGAMPTADEPAAAASDSAALGRLVVSLITDPRVQHGVEQVGNDVSQDHDQADHQQPAHDHVPITIIDRVDDQCAHAAPLEHTLGDDRATE